MSPVVQIAATERALYALDDAGNVWFRSLSGGAPISGTGWTVLEAPPEPRAQASSIPSVPAPRRQPAAAPAQAQAAPLPQIDEVSRARMIALADSMEASAPAKAAEIRATFGLPTSTASAATKTG